MDKISGKLTVYFEDPFWVGVFERISDGKLSVCKVTFGAEPKDYEVWDFVLRCYSRLMFSPAVEARLKPIVRNPKRRLRDAKKQTQSVGIGTKSQQALQMQREEKKLSSRKDSRTVKEAGKEQRIPVKTAKTKRKAQRTLNGFSVITGLRSYADRFFPFPGKRIDKATIMSHNIKNDMYVAKKRSWK